MESGAFELLGMPCLWKEWFLVPRELTLGTLQQFCGLLIYRPYDTFGLLGCSLDEVCQVLLPHGLREPAGQKASPYH